MTQIHKQRRGRPDKYPFWKNEVNRLFADDAKLSAVDAYGMLRAIRDGHPELKDKPLPPDARTVGRWKARFFLDNPTEADRSIYRTYRWPDAHVTGTLPWEAAELSLRILRFRLEHSRYSGHWDDLVPWQPETESRPHQSMEVLTENQALWAYRLRLAHPSWPLESLIEASEMFVEELG